ncbi:MAG TPA: phenylalanine--tRNA ligase subunit beta [Candidatus Tectomicrobia bacterium]|nr:phenylalanine--tRNA ligase subunit beta [Candidatus Tectomicrobia bacterium]
MRVSFEWLRAFVPVDLTPEAVAERLTMAGLEVEEVEDWGAPFERIVVGEILDIAAHPGREHLLVCRVGVGAEVLTIVCGAQNIAVGNHVPVAPVGSMLPTGRGIGAEEMGGVLSAGMLCSATDLGFSEPSPGILILPSATTAGTSLASQLGLRDVALEVNVTPNRPDCLSVFGIAREVAALTGVPLKPPAMDVPEIAEAIESMTSVTVEAPELCPRYAARLITNVHVGSSPLWMQRRLLVCGSRPRNNVVDATNYLLLELGHPLHAFDYDTLHEGRIVVRVARPAEMCVTLDGIARTLDPDVLVIADAERPVGIAGIMGGQNSEIRQTSSRILLESAYFQPQNIRRTSKRLSLRTEASYRFERGADFEGLIGSLDRCAACIAQLSSGAVAKGRIDVAASRYTPPRIPVRAERVNTVLGVDLTREAIAQYCSRLQLPSSLRTSAEVEIEVPSFRRDLAHEVDIIEEVGRLHSYQAIPTSLPRVRLEAVPRSPQRVATRRVVEALVGCGYTQVINYSFMAEEDLDRLQLPADDPWRRLVPLRNPLSKEAGVLRTTLVPSLLRTMALNLNRDLHDLMIFELSRVFRRQNGMLPQEPQLLSLAATGGYGGQHWGESARSCDFYDIVGALELIGARLRLQPFVVTAAAVSYAHPGKSALITIGDEPIGVVGEIHPTVLAAFDLSQSVTLAEIDFDRWLDQGVSPAQFRPIPRFPSVTRDVSIIVDAGVQAGQVLTLLQNFHPELLREVRLFDVYAGDPVPVGRKSLAFGLTYRADDRTLTDEEVNRIQTRVVQQLRQRFGAQLRGQEGENDHGGARH